MHPIHVSICNVDINGNENTVSIKLFKDDFALVLKNKSGVEIAMEKADEKSNSQIISKYINSDFQIEVNNGEILVLDYQKSEINEDAIWLYFHFKNIGNTSKLNVKNALMIELWEDQTNLLIVKWKEKESGYRFTVDETEMEINLND